MKNFKRFIAILLVAISMTTLLIPITASAASNETTISVSKPCLSKIVLKSGTTHTVKVDTSYGIVSGIKWSISNSKIATIKPDGKTCKFTTKSHGEATLTCEISYVLGKNQTLKLHINVYESRILTIKDPLKQSLNNTCAASSIINALKCMGKDINKNDITLNKEMSSSHTVGEVTTLLKNIAAKRINIQRIIKTKNHLRLTSKNRSIRATHVSSLCHSRKILISMKHIQLTDIIS